MSYIHTHTHTHTHTHSSFNWFKSNIWWICVILKWDLKKVWGQGVLYPMARGREFQVVGVIWEKDLCSNHGLNVFSHIKGLWKWGQRLHCNQVSLLRRKFSSEPFQLQRFEDCWKHYRWGVLPLEHGGPHCICSLFWDLYLICGKPIWV